MKDKFSKFRTIVCTCALIVAIFCSLYFFTGGLCLFRGFLGLPCPSCGMSRAALALLHGNFSLAAFYHVGIFFLPLLVLGLIFRKKKWGQAIIITLAVAFFIYYIYRMTHYFPYTPPLDFNFSAPFAFLAKIFLPFSK